MSSLRRAHPTVSPATRALCVAGALWLTACSGTKERPEPESYFATHVEDDGRRLFQYTLVMDSGADTSRRGGVPGGRSGGGPPTGKQSQGSPPGRGGNSPGGRGAAIAHMLEDGLERELGNSGFCPVGWRELDRMTGPTDFFIRGECLAEPKPPNDSAAGRVENETVLPPGD